MAWLLVGMGDTCVIIFVEGASEFLEGFCGGGVGFGVWVWRRTTLSIVLSLRFEDAVFGLGVSEYILEGRRENSLCVKVASLAWSPWCG